VKTTIAFAFEDWVGEYINAFHEEAPSPNLEA
jgi:hypothetical protein